MLSKELSKEAHAALVAAIAPKRVAQEVERALADYSRDDLASRTARAKARTAGKLPPRGKANAPFYVSIGHGVSLGYQLPTQDGRPGRWVKREYRGKVNGKPKYSAAILADADDLADANGESVLDFEQAETAARGTELLPAGAVTVQRAFDEHAHYVEWSAAKQTEIERTLKLNTSEAFRARVVAELDRETLSALKDSILARLVREKRESGERDEDEILRASKASASRYLKTINAALNRAAKKYDHIRNREAWRAALKPYPKRETFAKRYCHFNEQQFATLLAASQQESAALALLVIGGWLTGMRIGELTSLLVRDFEASTDRLHLRRSKTKKSREKSIKLEDDALKHFARLVRGRDADAPMFTDDDGKAWTQNHVGRLFKRAIERTDLDRKATFYALRHSFITLAIAAKVDLVTIAKHCGTSVAQIEQTYAQERNMSYRPKVPSLLKLAA